MLKNLYKWNIFIILLTAGISGLITSIWAYQHNYITVYADGVSHLNIARRVLDNLQPGIAQLGASWLPVYHLLLLPLVQSNFLWHSGLAGTLVSEISFVISSLFIYLIIYQLTNSKKFSFVSSIAFIFTPDILYMATTPMTEIFTVMLMLGATYFLIKWVNTQSNFTLLTSSAFVALGVLTRYEVWFYAVISILLVALIEFLKYKNFKKAEGITILYATPIALSFFLWIGWNLIIFHDPLYFYNGIFSASAYQIPLEKAGQLPTEGNIFNASYYYLQALGLINGWVYVIISIIGFFVFYLFSFKKFNYLILLVLASPILFEIISLFSGSTAIWVPNLFPFQMYNIRYGIYGSVFIFIFLPLIFYKLKKVGLFLFILVISLQIVIFATSGLPISLRDGLVGRNDASGKSVIEAANFIKSNYSSGLIMAPSGALDPFIFATGLPNKVFITEGVRKYWDESIVHPEKYATWIVLTKISNGTNIRDGIQEASVKNPLYFKDFKKVFDKGSVLIYKKK